MYQIILTQKNYTKNPNTKTTYLLESEEQREIKEKEHDLLTNDKVCKSFRSAGGSESKIHNYTCKGYKVVKLTSTSPDKTKKTVRNFEFIYNN